MNHSKKILPSSLSANRHFAKNLLTVGAALITGGLLLLLVFVAQQPIQQSQDVNSQASVAKGSVEITAHQSPQQFVAGSPSTIDLRANTSGVGVDGLQLVFDVITPSGQTLEVKNNTARLKVVSQEVQKVAHGFKVSILMITQQPDQSFVTSSPESFLHLTLTPTVAGEISLNFDVERSISTQHASDPPKDLLTHVPVFKFAVSAADPNAAVDDLYLVSDNITSRFTIKETTGSQNEVDKDRLVVGRRYSVTHQAKIQNTKDATGNDTIISAKLKVNDSDSESSTRTFKKLDLNSTTEPITLQFETTFVAKESNTFSVLVDSTNVYAEADENNNTTSTTFGSSATPKSCNEVCSSNADCANNYQCYDTGSDKRCRLNTNLNSTACSDPFGAGNRSCNQYCANDSECKSGLTCWYNQCRSPYNVESSSCPVPSTQQLQDISTNCNKACSSNRDCANNMRCYNSQCRLATNPGSTSCSVATAPTVSQTYSKPTPAPSVRPTATPKASATPTPSSSPRPSLSPTPTPSPSASPDTTTTDESDISDDSALSAFVAMILESMNFDINSLLTGSLLPIAVIGAGILFLIISVIVMLKPRGRTIHTNHSAAPPPVPVQGEMPRMDMHTKPNPTPPPLPGHGVITKISSSTHDKTVSGISNAGTIEMPNEGGSDLEKNQKIDQTLPDAQPQQPPAASPTPTGGTGTTMVQRLKEKGVTMPPQSGDAAKPAQPASSGWTNEETK